MLTPIASYSQDYVGKLPELNSTYVQIIEGESFCSTGVGSQNTSFKIAGQEVHSKSQSTAYSPSFDYYDSPFLRIDCSINNFVGGYSYLENSVHFNEDVTYKEKLYNVADFKNNNIYFGYSLSLYPHFLYVDLGVGYYQTQYTLDYLSGGGLRGSDTEDLTSSGPFVYSNLKWFVKTYLYFHWLNQRAVDDENAVIYINQIGVNFSVKL